MSLSIKKGELLELYIEKLAYGGMGFSHYDDIVIFVKGAIPGQTVKAKVYKKKKRYLEAYVVEIIKSSKFQVTPKCSHFGVCGGCSFQNYLYNNQLAQKKEQVENLFDKLGGLKKIPIKPIIGCDNQYNYRNKMEFTYSPNKWILDYNKSTNYKQENALGLHVKNRFDKIVDIDNCYLHTQLSDSLLSVIKKLLSQYNIEPFDVKSRTGYLKNVLIRTSYDNEEILINFITINNDDTKLISLVKSLIKEFKEIKSIIHTVVKPNSGSSFSDQEKILWGENFINENIGDYSFKISSNSFFQTNSHQAKKLYDMILDCGQFNGKEIVYDLYCGTGSIGIYLAKYVSMVYGVEVVMSAIIDAIENAQNNNVSNIQFMHGDLNNFFDSNNESKIISKPDVVILDPPRAGLHKNTVNSLIKFNAKKIIYVSCNPATQVRDIVLFLNDGYKLKNVQPIDMFPHTPHIENIALLQK